MAVFDLTAAQVTLLASCITIGFESADQNHEDIGGENTTDDLEALAALLEELDAIAARDGSAEITIMGNEA